MIAGDPEDVPVIQQIFNQRLGSKCGVQLRRDHATTLVPEKQTTSLKKTNVFVYSTNCSRTLDS